MYFSGLWSISGVRPTCRTFLRPFFIFKIFFIQIACIYGTDGHALELLASFLDFLAKLLVPLLERLSQFHIVAEDSTGIISHRKWWLTSGC